MISASSTGTKAAPRRIGSTARPYPLGERRRNEALRNAESGRGIAVWAKFESRIETQCWAQCWGLPSSRARSKLRTEVISLMRWSTGIGKFITVIKLNPELSGGSGFSTMLLARGSESIWLLPARGILWQNYCRRERHEDLPNMPRKLSKQLPSLPRRW